MGRLVGSPLELVRAAVELGQLQGDLVALLPGRLGGCGSCVGCLDPGLDVGLASLHLCLGLLQLILAQADLLVHIGKMAVGGLGALVDIVELAAREAGGFQQARHELRCHLLPPVPAVVDIVAPILKRRLDLSFGKGGSKLALGPDAAFVGCLAADEGHRHLAQGAQARVAQACDQVDRRAGEPVSIRGSVGIKARVIGAGQGEQAAPELRLAQEGRRRVGGTGAAARKDGLGLGGARLLDEAQELA